MWSHSVVVFPLDFERMLMAFASFSRRRSHDSLSKDGSSSASSEGLRSERNLLGKFTVRGLCITLRSQKDRANR